jgi:hypothetical protein
MNSMKAQTRIIAPLAIVYCMGLALLVTAPLLIGTPGDDEDLRFAVPTTLLHLNHLWSLEWAKDWTPYWAFGSPLPEHAHFGWHPLGFLFWYLDPIRAIGVIAWTHLTLFLGGLCFAFYRFRIPPVAAGLLVGIAAFSSPVNNFLVVDLWVSNFPSFSLIPWAIVICLKVFGSEDANNRWFWIACLIFVLSSMVIWGHASLAFYYVPICTLPALLNWKNIRTRKTELAVVSLVAAVIVLFKVSSVAVQLAHFSPDLVRTTAVFSIYDWDRVLEVLMGPIPSILVPENPRTLYLGFLVVPLAFYSSFTLYRKGRGDERSLGALSLLLVLALLLNIEPTVKMTSGMVLRDVLAVLLIINLGVSSKYWWTKKSRKYLVGLCFCLAFLQLGLEFQRLAGSRLVGGPKSRFSSLDLRRARNLTETFLPERTLFTPGAYQPAGFGHRPSVHDSLYRGEVKLQGLMKGVTSKNIYPETGFPYGEIGSSWNLVLDLQMLQFLAVRNVIIRQNELQRVPSISWLISTDLQKIHYSNDFIGIQELPAIHGVLIPTSAPNVESRTLSPFRIRSLSSDANWRLSKEITLSADSMYSANLHLPTIEESMSLVLPFQYFASFGATDVDSKEALSTYLHDEFFLGIRLYPGTQNVRVEVRNDYLGYLRLMGGILYLANMVWILLLLGRMLINYRVAFRT